MNTELKDAMKSMVEVMVENAIKLKTLNNGFHNKSGYENLTDRLKEVVDENLRGVEIVMIGVNNKLRKHKWTVDFGPCVGDKFPTMTVWLKKGLTEEEVVESVEKASKAVAKGCPKYRNNK